MRIRSILMFQGSVVFLDYISQVYSEISPQKRKKELTRLDMAFMNASVMNTSFKIVPSTGHEDIIQLNYLSTILLSLLLLPVLKSKSPDGAPVRLSIITSMTSINAKFVNKNQVPLLPSFDDQSISIILMSIPHQNFWVRHLCGSSQATSQPMMLW